MNEGLVVVARSIIAFFTLLIFARTLGRQQISQLTFFDYVLGITIGSIAASLSVDLSSRAWPHWVGLLTWAAAVLLLQWISLKSREASKYLVSEPTVVIMDGLILEDALRSIRYTMTDILEQLRDKGIFDLNQV
ncbi:MAG TPA: YetF domain-containing protein, partial [Syntrophomonadaceae bacterium]|nr:YetF domain-containing protein [Syntrophomonadaceae bacterium]